MLSLTLLTAGCLDPSTDYQDWLSRSADARAGITTASDASFDGMLSGSFDQTYVMACDPQLAPDMPSQALLFNAHVTFHQSGGTGDGTLDVTYQSLKAHATDTTMTTGTPETVTGTAVMGGMAAVMFPTSTIPGDANTITPGQAIVLQSSTLYFDIASSTELCAGLAGMVTKPIPLMLDKTKNICRFKTPMGTTVPTYTVDEFKSCP